MKKQPKILIVAHENLPVPNVLGGAVELLVQYIVEENEKYNLLDLTILSIYNKEAKDISSKYKNTKFHFIHPARGNRFNICAKFWWFVDAVRARYLHKTPLPTHYTRQVCNFIKSRRDEFDFVVFENNLQFVNVKLPRIKGDYLFHLHNDFINKESISRCRNSIPNGVLQFTGILCVSNFIERQINEALPSSRTILFPNAIRAKDFYNENTPKYRANLRGELNIPDSSIVYLFTGRIIPGKGVKELIEAFNMMTSDDSYLIIVGGVDFSNNTVNPFLQELKGLTTSNDRIIFTGYIQSSIINRYYAAADVVVIPSIIHIEASPLSAIEAIMSKKPIIISDSGGLEDWKDEEFAITVSRGVNFTKELFEAMSSLNWARISNMTCDMDRVIAQRDTARYYSNFTSIINNGK